jgi:adenylylsulfate kinase
MIIAMAGLPGTGKSAIAARLRQELPAAVLDKDRIRAALFAPEHIEYSTEQDDFCMEIMLTTAAYLLGKGRGQHVILDGRTFSRQYQIVALDRFAAGHDVPLKIVECVCSDEVARQRLAQDVADGMHPAGNRDFSLYLAIKARYEPIREPKLVVNTENDLDTCVGQCLAHLREGGTAAPAA